MTTIPKQVLHLDERAMGKLQRLIDDLEEHADVVEVTTNAEPPDDVPPDDAR